MRDWYEKATTSFSNFKKKSDLKKINSENFEFCTPILKIFLAIVPILPIFHTFFCALSRFHAIFQPISAKFLWLFRCPKVILNRIIFTCSADRTGKCSICVPFLLYFIPIFTQYENFHVDLVHKLQIFSHKFMFFRSQLPNFAKFIGMNSNRISTEEWKIIPWILSTVDCTASKHSSG